MLTERRSTKIGAALLVFAMVLRLLTGAPAWQGKDPVTSIQKLPFVPTQAQTAPTEPTAPLPVIPSFTASDADKTRLRYSCDYRVEVEKLLEKDLQWQLSDGQPAVLIVHTHGSESYTKELGQTYQETAQYRTLDEHYNMVAVGDLLAALLEAAGIRVIHDRQLHDYPSYTSSYNNSRKSVQEYLQEYPSIRLVLDLHRDAGENSDGSQFATHAKVDGKDSAQIMFLVGTDESGNYHPRWRDNLAVAAKLNVLMENINPGITRKTTLRAQRFNQDLADIALLVEVGSAGNTLQEALTAIPILAEAIIALKNGANW
jgi:stage II sporulation protein P